MRDDGTKKKKRTGPKKLGTSRRDLRKRGTMRENMTNLWLEVLISHDLNRTRLGDAERSRQEGLADRFVLFPSWRSMNNNFRLILNPFFLILLFKTCASFLLVPNQNWLCTRVCSIRARYRADSIAELSLRATMAGWTPQMKLELQKVFDSTVKKPGYATRQEIVTIAKRVHEDPEELEGKFNEKSSITVRCAQLVLHHS